MTHSAPAPHSIAVFTMALIIVSLLAGPLLAVSGGKLETLPIQKAAPPAVVIEATGSEADLRGQIRAKNAVTELPTGTVYFSHAPMGSFGFIAPQSLGIALVMQSPDLALERVAPTPNAYEVHKLADGSGLLVGFVGKEIVSQITPRERAKNLRITLYSNLLDKAPLIAAVPLTKLMVDRMPVRVDPRTANGPVMLDMDLQSTANRRSPVGE